MAQDIRELLRQDNKIPTGTIRKGHKDRFLAKLDQELPVKKSTPSFYWLKIAASITVLFSISVLTFNQLNTGANANNPLVDAEQVESKNATVVLPKQNSALAKMNPDFEKIENTFLTAMKVQLTEINITDENREMVDSYMKRLKNLDEEYQRLSKELIEVGPNTQNVDAMIENLTMRLNLLKRLNEQLKALEKIENEDYYEIQA
ncbi:hypothetical protein [Aquimarina brevivitae]|uniref:Uncharacterized protein n=1 Tax=Aquimarina brevivitae TaxID=323412 RepID=A0A4V2F7L8_9FLAO|nr:hypothetical protein [Aquimarina brevivitae]RZT00270.1 hypothetical protein EV197_1506 [Aquimarina brevivitae]